MGDNATIRHLEKINSVYVQTIRGQDARIAELEAQLAAAQERERGLVDALRQIADYDKGVNRNQYGQGICPYGCDTPSIAQAALAAAQQEER